MSWQETSPGRYERPLDDIEIFFKEIADQGKPLNREHWAVRIYAQFQYDASPSETLDALQRSWKTVRYDHPEIASYTGGDKKVYEVPSSAALGTWMKETFHVNSSLSIDEVLSNVHPSRLAAIHYLPQTSEILISSSHWRIDGVGAIHLLNKFFKTLAEPHDIKFGDEWRNLSPGLGEAAGLSKLSTQENLEAAADLLRKYTTNVPSIGLPIQDERQMPGNTLLERLTLSPSTTLALIVACKNRGYTVTTALHTALILATQQLSPKDAPSKKYTSWGSFSLRPYVQPPYNTSTHPVSVYLVGFPITLTPSSFSSNAFHLKKIYSNFSSLQPSFDLKACLIPYIKEATALFSQPPPADARAATEPVLDSLGFVDRYLQQDFGNGVEVRDFWLASETLSKQLTVYVWTWRGKLVFSTCYNATFYRGDFVRDFLQRVKSILLVELEIVENEAK